MKTEEEFINLIDKKAFNYIFDKTLIPYTEYTEKPKREDFLGHSYKRLHQNIVNYKPAGIRKVITTPKSLYCIRMVPTFFLEDFYIYYYLVKSIENFLAMNRVKNTFGGFRFGGEFPRKEKNDMEEIKELVYQDYYTINSFNPAGWVKEFRNYKEICRHYLERLGVEYETAIKLDIANFYDNIRVNQLQNKIEKLEIDCQDELYLLIRFLNYWNNNQYQPGMVGLPQDEFGDCSRILANFYLIDYDQKIRNLCEKYNAEYIRYADDQLILFKDRNDVNKIMRHLNNHLHSEGLNLNNNKIIELNNYEEANINESFDIFDCLINNPEEGDFLRCIELMKERKSKAIRVDSILKRLSYVSWEKISVQVANYILELFKEPKNLLYLNETNLTNFYDRFYDLDPKMSQGFVGSLDVYFSQSIFESCQIYYKRFKKRFEEHYS